MRMFKINILNSDDECGKGSREQKKKKQAVCTLLLQKLQVLLLNQLSFTKEEIKSTLPVQNNKKKI